MCFGIIDDDVTSSNTVTCILNIPEHIELDEDILLFCLEAIATAYDVDVASSHLVTRDDDTSVGL
jgi:hypothetical protein